MPFSEYHLRAEEAHAAWKRAEGFVPTPPATPRGEARDKAIAELREELRRIVSATFRWAEDVIRGEVTDLSPDLTFDPRPYTDWAYDPEDGEYQVEVHPTPRRPLVDGAEYWFNVHLRNHMSHAGMSHAAEADMNQAIELSISWFHTVEFWTPRDRGFEFDDKNIQTHFREHDWDWVLCREIARFVGDCFALDPDIGSVKGECIPIWGQR